MKYFFSSRLLLNALLAGILFVFLFSSCHKESAQPAYLHVEPFTVITDFTKQGSTSSQIKDVWVYVNNKNLGAYQLPCNIPVIGEGVSQIILTPGVLNGGITTKHLQYPFYASEFDTVTLVKNKTINFQPKTHYVEGLKFSFKEDFQNGTDFIKLMGDTGLVLGNSAAQKFEGGYGKITLDPLHDTVEIVNATPDTLPLNTTPVFVEMDYKCDIEFTIGLYIKTSTSIIKYWHETFKPTSSWNKVYVDITSPVNSFQGITYQVIFKAGNTSGGITSAQSIYLDNVKLISR